MRSRPQWRPTLRGRVEGQPESPVKARGNLGCQGGQRRIAVGSDGRGVYDPPPPTRPHVKLDLRLHEPLATGGA